MAKQQRIGIYGSGIQPTGIDSGAVDKMRALAGLGQTVADVGIAIAKPIIKAKGAEKGAQAAEEAFKAGTEVEKKTFGFSASEYNAAAAQTTAALEASYKSKVTLDIDANLFRIQNQNKSNTQEFTNDAEGYIQGVREAAPASMRPLIDTYFQNKYQAGFRSVNAAENKANVDFVKANYAIDNNTVQGNILSAIEEGNPEEAAFLENFYREEVLPGFVAGGAVTLEELANSDIEFKKKKERASVFGSVNNDIINNEDLDMDQRIAAGKKYLKAFDEADIGVSPEEKRDLRAEVVGLFDNAEKRDKLAIEEATIDSYMVQNKTLDALDTDVIYNDDLTSNEKITAIRKAMLDKKIGSDDGKNRIAYLNSKDKLDATTDLELVSELTSLTYDVLSLKSTSDYLIGVKNIKDEVLSLQESGKLTQDGAQGILNIFNNLTQSRTAKSGEELGLTMSKAKNILKTMVAPEYYSSGMRYLFYNAEPEIRDTNAEREAELLKEDPGASERDIKKVLLTSDEKIAIYTRRAKEAVDQIKQDQSERARVIIDRTVKTQTGRNVTIPTVTTNAQYQALKVGDEYKFKGKTRVK